MIAVSRGCSHDVPFLGRKTCLMFFKFVCKVSGWQATLPWNMTSLRFSNHILRSSLSPWCLSPSKHFTAQKMKFSIKDFFSKWDQIRSFLRIWSHLLKKSLMENFIFMQLWVKNTQVKTKWGHKKQDMRCFARTSNSIKVTKEQHLVIKNSYIIRYLVPTKTFLLK